MTAPCGIASCVRNEKCTKCIGHFFRVHKISLIDEFSQMRMPKRTKKSYQQRQENFYEVHDAVIHVIIFALPQFKVSEQF